jgi:hypothetical protein
MEKKNKLVTATVLLAAINVLITVLNPYLVGELDFSRHWLYFTIAIISVLSTLLGFFRRESKRHWVTYVTGIAVFFLSTAALIIWINEPYFPFYRSATTYLDSAHYHLGDNVYRYDTSEHAMHQSPGGDNMSNIAFYDKDLSIYYFDGEVVKTSEFSKYNLENYKHVGGGDYYLRLAAVSYIKRFDLRLELQSQDIDINKIRMIRCYFIANVFDVSKAVNGGEITLKINDRNQYVINDVVGNEPYTWNVLRMEIPTSFLEERQNTFQISVSPKLTEFPVYHFEDFEISRLKIEFIYTRAKK